MRVWNKHDPQCPPTAVYVGRPTKWGNRWSHLPSPDPSVMRVANRDAAVAMYRYWLMETKAGRQLQADARRELRGKDLACWCVPSKCHALLLLEVANVNNP